MNRDEAVKLVEANAIWHHAFEIYPGVITPGNYNPGFLWDKLALPADMRGMRCLDIGASDGFFSMKMAQCGADVVCVDYRRKDLHGFEVMERISGLKFSYHQINIYDLTVAEFGRFDIILFLGVLYHLPDMLRAFDTIRRMSLNKVFIETHSDNEFSPNVPAARYYAAATLNGDNTNFWAPNAMCVKDMIFDAGFRLSRTEAWGDRLFAEAEIDNTPARSTKLERVYGVFG
jgi:tRNA (mo5U34)-methyltransferase